MNTTLDSRAGSVFWVQPPEKLIKQLPNLLEKVDDSITNNLQLESLNSDFVWESYGVWKLGKFGRKILTGILTFSSWKQMEGMEGF